MNVRVCFLELVRESESDHWQASIIVRGSLVLFPEHQLLGTLECMLALLAVNVGHARVPASCFQGFAQQPRVRQSILHDLSVTIETEVDQVVVLRNDLSTWTRKVQCVRLFRAAEIVELEDQMFRQVTFVSPDDPANTSVHQAEFMPRGVD